MHKRIGAHALVVGGSMAGLLAARVLADHYDTVTIVDRDELAEGDGARGGVPQGRHAHGLLTSGRDTLEGYFPGLAAELITGGAPSGDLLGNSRFWAGGHLLKRHQTGLLALGPSRPFLEARVRARVRAIDNVMMIDRTDVVGLTVDGDRARVTGVRVVSRGGDREERLIDADLVVDASGRGSKTPVWLAEFGWPAPTEDRVPIDLAYTTQVFHRGPQALGGDVVILLGYTPQHRRSAIAALMEGDKVLVSLVGILGDYPPTDDEGFRRFAESLCQPDIAEAIRGLTPVGPAVSFRFAESRWRRYDKLSRFPAGLLVIGDAICSVNPAYAQGMSVAALQSTALRDALARGRPVDARRFFRAAAKATMGAWQIAAGADLALPEVPGRRTLADRLIGRYVARVQAVAAHDEVIAAAFVRVAALVESPPNLMRPNRLFRVLRPRRRRPSPAASVAVGR
jgi:2-polyprenyl-6-methoxyphenol hydroxylase-like FAD-dependent oxidoreductase